MPHENHYLTIRDAEVQVWHQNVEGDFLRSPDSIIEGGDLRQIDVKERSDDVMDEVKIDVRDPRGYGEYDLRLGDRVRVLATFSDDSTLDWMGRVLPSESTRNHPGFEGGDLTADATDWIGDVLVETDVTNAWSGADTGRIIREVCRTKDPRIDTSNVPDLGVETEQLPDSRDTWDFICELAALSDAVIYQDGFELHVQPIEGLGHVFDLERPDYNLPWKDNKAGGVKNIIRVDSGTARQSEEQNLEQATFTRVTENSRVAYKLRARKSTIHSVDLYVRSVSDEDLKVRIQAGEDGAPIAPNDTEPDIDEASWSASELPNEGWQAFFLNGEILPDRDPWMLIESGGEEGHDIGVDSGGDPTCESFYPHPVNIEVTSTESIAEYGPREYQVDRDGLRTLLAARHAAQSVLARRAWQERTVEIPARSKRAHALRPGDMVGVDEPREEASGDWIVTEVSRTLGNSSGGGFRLDTTISATWRKGVLAPVNG